MYSDDDLREETVALFERDCDKPFNLDYRQIEEEEERGTYRFFLGLKNSPSEHHRILTSGVNILRSCRVRFFFATVQGFYTGSLDLRGRHLTRYSEVQALWQKYLSSFVDLSVGISSTLKKRPWNDRVTVKFSFTNKGDWTDFRKLWKIPATIDYEELYWYTRETLHVISEASGMPKIQKICLVDLPTETLDIIFSYCPLDRARHLTSTCQRLNKIGVVHATSARDIIIKRSPSFLKEMEECGIPFDEFFVTTALASRNLVLDYCHYLENRPDHLDRLKSLEVSNEWYPLSDLEEPVFHANPVSTLDNNRFYQPIYKSLQGILGSTLNLTSFGFFRLQLTLDLLICLCHLPKLDYLNFNYSTISTEVITALNLDSDGFLNTSVRHLHLMPAREESSWYAMLFCPKLSSFTADNYEDPYTMYPPTPNLWGRLPFLPSLKYLCLGNLAIWLFVDWIQQSFQGSTPALTHLRIIPDYGASTTGIITLLRAVHGAPLTFLSIEGICHLDPSLFSCIAQEFPCLLDLVVYSRDSTRQRRNIRTQWHFPVWEYAHQFGGFSRLQRFCWNNRTKDMNYSTSLLLDLEDGWKNNLFEDLMGFFMEVGHDPDIDIFDDWRDIRLDTALFGTYCPTLRMLSILEEGSYIIARTSNGDVDRSKIRSTYNYEQILDPNLCWPF